MDLIFADEHGRHQRYLENREHIVQLWKQHLAGPAGPLRGAILAPAPIPHGWCGQVQLVPGEHHFGDVKDAVEAIAETYGTPAGAVVVEPSRSGTADEAFIWVFFTISAADHHRSKPITTLDVHGRGREPAPTRASDSELGHLADWAWKYSATWNGITRPGRGAFDVDRFLHRLLRLRGAVLDLLPRTTPGVVKSILVEAGITRECLPRDLAETVCLDSPTPA
jgi:hypothetical protein